MPYLQNLPSKPMSEYSLIDRHRTLLIGLSKGHSPVFFFGTEMVMISQKTYFSDIFHIIGIFYVYYYFFLKNAYSTVMLFFHHHRYSFAKGSLLKWKRPQVLNSLVKQVLKEWKDIGLCCRGNVDVFSVVHIWLAVAQSLL